MSGEDNAFSVDVVIGWFDSFGNSGHFDGLNYSKLMLTVSFVALGRGIVSPGRVSDTV